MFAGFGPVILGIIFAIIETTQEGFSLSGYEVLIAIASTYLLAFVQAGASVFNQIESWPIAKSLFCHFGSIYLAYVLCYVVNTWIPFEIMAVVIFTAIFLVVYAVAWLTVYFIVKASEKKLNAKF
jgi:hypothetical protein